MKLFAEETSASIAFKEMFKKVQDKTTLSIPETTLTKIQILWREVFPKRELFIEKNKILVKSILASEKEQTYQPNQLSDGELVSFYMIARILDSTAKILIIDEPEIHDPVGLNWSRFCVKNWALKGPDYGKEKVLP